MSRALRLRFPWVFSLRQVAENTHGNKRPDNDFDFGKDYRDSLRPTRRMTVSLMKKGGPPLYPHKSGWKYGIYGQTWQCLMKKHRPMRRQGLQLPLLCIILPLRPCLLLRPSSAYHILVFTACFSHGKPVFRTFDDI